jgi:hypothetical protein
VDVVKTPAVETPPGFGVGGGSGGGGARQEEHHPFVFDQGLDRALNAACAVGASRPVFAVCRKGGVSLRSILNASRALVA